jgi:hypothetical protein
MYNIILFGFSKAIELDGHHVEYLSALAVYMLSHASNFVHNIMTN